MRELTKTEISYIISLVVSFVLFFLAFGLIITSTPGIIVPYAALFAAIALSSSTLMIAAVKSRNKTSDQTKPEPIVLIPQVLNEKPVVATQPVKEEQKVQKVENNYRALKVESKVESTELYTAEPFHYGKTKQSGIAKPKIEVNEAIEEPSKPLKKTDAKKNIAKSTSDEKAKADQETVKGVNGKFTCPKCSKEFGQPIFMVSYDELKQPKLVAHCPYCDQALNIKQKNSEEEELLKKYF